MSTVNLSAIYMAALERVVQNSVERMREKVQEIKGIVSVEGTVKTQDTDFTIRGGVLERYNGNDVHVVIPDSVVEIGKAAFEGCAGIQSVTIPPNVKTIRDYAFKDCTSLESINIPDRVERSAEWEVFNSKYLYGVFQNCPALREIIISEEQKEKLFGLGEVKISTRMGGELYGYLSCPSALYDVFEEWHYDADDNKVYSDKNCGPWYLNHKRELWRKAKAQGEMKLKNAQAERAERRAKGKCQYCGASFSGLFTKRCYNCGKLKDY